MINHLLVRGAFAAMLGLPTFAMAALPVIEVYKSASCGCCSAWIKHLETNGFTVRAKNVEMPAQYRKLAGIPDALGSCHTGLVNGYAIEGHVPASEIKQLLRENPGPKAWPCRQCRWARQAWKDRARMRMTSCWSKAMAAPRSTSTTNRH